MGLISCQPGTTDYEGRFEITCPLDDVMAGQARVTIEYNAYDNNDRYRYKNASVTRLFPVFSNSTLHISEVGPFKTDVDRYEYANGNSFPVLYLKEAYHINAILQQSNGNPLGGKCLNIYLNPDENTRPVATATTGDELGEVEWYSGEMAQNPSRKGIEPSGNQLEGFRVLRLAYEPDVEVPGGCRAEANAVVNGSFMDVLVLVRSRVDMVVKVPWHNVDGYLPGDTVEGAVAILRDRIDLVVEDETVTFIFQYLNSTDVWVTQEIRYVKTDEQGVANFSWTYTGKDVPGAADDEYATGGKWQITAMFEGSEKFKKYGENRSLVIFEGDAPEKKSSAWDLKVMLPIIIAFLFAAIIGAVMY